MSIRVMILGDVVGAVGALAVAQCVPALRERWQPNVVIANAENVVNGSGLTPGWYQKLCEAGVDGITLGDHVYKKQQIRSVLEREPNIIRPANLPRQAVGRRWMRLPLADRGTDGPYLYVLTVMGRMFMNLPVNDPFMVADEVLAELPERDPLVVVEVHAEATSEKVALGWYLNGRVAGVFGTHTHVPTADGRILPEDPQTGREAMNGGTAYVTDLGMCGPYDSVLGRRVDRVLMHMTTSMPAPFDVAEHNLRVCGVMIEIDERKGKAVGIERVEMSADRDKPPFV